MAGQFWIGLAVSVVAWFIADWIAGLLFSDPTTQFVFSFILAVLGGIVVMTAWRVRSLRSGKYRKAGWGVKRR